MFQPTITKVIKEKGQIVIVVDYVDGKEIITRDYRMDGYGDLDARYKSLIQNDLDSFNKAYTFADKLQPGTPDLTPKSDEVSPNG